MLYKNIEKKGHIKKVEGGYIYLDFTSNKWVKTSSERLAVENYNYARNLFKKFFR